MNGKVYYNNVILHEADPHTLQDLGYGYAKDNENVWLEGRLLPLVDARSFRLKNSAPPVPPSGGDFDLGDIIAGIFGPGFGQDPGHGQPGYGQGHGQHGHGGLCGRMRLSGHCLG